MKEWIINNLNWLIPLTITTIFACFNICIAWLNYKCAKKQREMQNDSFCYQLFDKRLNVYYSIQEILGKLISSPDNAKLLWQPFLQKTRDVSFLFGKDIQDKCKEIYNDIIDLQANNDVLKETYDQLKLAEHRSSNITDDRREELKIQRDQLSKKINILSKKIYSYNTNLKELFQPYISFAKYQITSESSSKNSDDTN